MSTRKPKTLDPNEIDPSVYYYDEVYDDMKLEEEEDSRRTHADRKNKSKQASKYIAGLVESAKERKTDQEIRKFKKYARDREEAEARGEMDDVDVYISSSYKRKLEDIKKIAADKKLRSEKEERRFNFEREQPRSKDSKASDIRKPGNSESDIESGTDKTKSSSKESKSEDLTVELPFDSLKPKTAEDRRKYLQEVLAKRTVGEVFEAALKRYQLRVSGSHASA